MKKKIIIVFTLVVCIVGSYTYLSKNDASILINSSKNLVENPDEVKEKKSAFEQEQESKEDEERRLRVLVEKYKDLKIVDVHNHDSSEEQYKRSVKEWDKLYIDQVILFGNVSEPAAVDTDEISWMAYQRYPDRILPFFSGVDIHSVNGIDTVKERLEQGFMGLGEIAAASTMSPIVSKVKWKGAHPMDGYLPDIYELCAQYKAPVLLHIDPLIGDPLFKLKEALLNYPNTTFILAHGNVGLSPAAMKFILNDYSNLYIDFYAGYTAYDSLSKYKLVDYAPIIEQFQSQFVLGTDSGYGTSYNQAALAIYELIDLLTPSTAEKVSHKNIESLIEAQPITTSQLQKLQKLTLETENTLEISKLNKREANELIFTLQKDNE